jgi:raffinose/stachyose/melibiose transport system permease protein
MSYRYGPGSNRLIRRTSRVLLVLAILGVIYPVIFVALTALKPTQEFYTNTWGLPDKVQLSNFSEAWTRGRIGEYVINSVIVVVISVALIVVLGALAGYALARLRLPRAEFVLLAIIGIALLPGESVIMPLYIMMSRLGIVGGYGSLIIPYVGWALPFAIYIFNNFFHTLPNELIESARVDGCNDLQAFWRISVPLMLPAVGTVAIFNFVGLWGELYWATIALATSQLRTLPLGIIAFQGQFGTNWGPLSAAICIVLVPLFVVFLFLQKYFVRGLTTGAVKA